MSPAHPNHRLFLDKAIGIDRILCSLLMLRILVYSGSVNEEKFEVEQSEIELEYERRWKAMSPAEKVARSAAMLAWTREQMAIRVRFTQPSLSDEEVRLHVALQLYERDPEVVRLIQKQLADVSR